MDRFSRKIHKLVLTHLCRARLPACSSYHGYTQPAGFPPLHRLYSCSRVCSSHLRSAALQDRGLIRVQGPDSSSFLQGLFTNDINLISEERNKSIYTLVLNVQGRVLYDVLVYNTSEDLSTPCYLLECDSQIISEFIKMMKKYKIRRKVDIAETSDELQTWAVFPEDGSTACEAGEEVNTDPSVVAAVQDPRLPQFGQRFVLKRGTDTAELGIPAVAEDAYLTRRFLWGLGEGVKELPPGGCFPLESNVEFLNGVSFSKGCYIGQELTARTYHTGVTRKRIMPIMLQSEENNLTEADGIVNSAGKSSGKFRNASGKYGLALLRINDVITKQPLVIRDSDGKTLAEATTHMPDWWPKDSDEELKKAVAHQKMQS